MELNIKLALALFALMSMSAFAAGFAGGDGTEGSPYQIEDCADLQNISSNLTAYYIINNDIDCGVPPYNTGAGFPPVGECGDLDECFSGDYTYSFSGVLDGGGYDISNLLINLSGHDMVGLFGSVGEANISNVNIVDANLTGGNFVGAVAGQAYDSLVRNCSSSGYAFGTYSTGGLVGSLRTSAGDSEIHTSYSSVNVTSTGDMIGGLIGSSMQGTMVNSSYAHGSVSGDEGSSRVGGLIGLANTATIIDCYSTGNITNVAGSVGGFIGLTDTVTISDSFWDTQTSGTAQATSRCCSMRG